MITTAKSKIVAAQLRRSSMTPEEKKIRRGMLRLNTGKHQTYHHKDWARIDLGTLSLYAQLKENNKRRARDKRYKVNRLLMGGK